jgi:amphi-Trp domain-containing protein
MSVRVLVADDERAVRDSLRRALVMEGYDVEEAAGGREALDTESRGGSMSKKFKKKTTVSRQEAANRMIAIGEALAASGQTTPELGGEAITATVPDQVTFELEVKDAELEIELKWQPTPSAKPDDEASNEPSAPSPDRTNNQSPQRPPTRPNNQAATATPDRFAE